MCSRSTAASRSRSDPRDASTPAFEQRQNAPAAALGIPGTLPTYGRVPRPDAAGRARCGSARRADSQLVCCELEARHQEAPGAGDGRSCHAGGCGRRLVVLLLRAAAGGGRRRAARRRRHGGAGRDRAVQVGPIQPPSCRVAALERSVIIRPRSRGGSSSSASRKASRSRRPAAGAARRLRLAQRRRAGARPPSSARPTTSARSICCSARPAPPRRVTRLFADARRSGGARARAGTARQERHHGTLRWRGRPAQGVGRRLRRRRPGHGQSRADRPLESGFPWRDLSRRGQARPADRARRRRLPGRRSAARSTRSIR